MITKIKTYLKSLFFKLKYPSYRFEKGYGLVFSAGLVIHNDRPMFFDTIDDAMAYSATLSKHGNAKLVYQIFDKKKKVLTYGEVLIGAN